MSEPTLVVIFLRGGADGLSIVAPAGDTNYIAARPSVLRVEAKGERKGFAMKDALEDIPRQARRLARWRSRPVAERRPPRESPLRAGRPPGWRLRPTHEVHEILKECHWLARNAHLQLDTS
mgnify:CR=1 FL=1